MRIPSDIENVRRIRAEEIPSRLVQDLAAPTIAQQIKQWRADIRIMTAGTRNETAVLVYAWNWATSPTALRTDREHRACRRFARQCWSRLIRRDGWHESDSGRLWI